MCENLSGFGDEINTQCHNNNLVIKYLMLSLCLFLISQNHKKYQIFLRNHLVKKINSSFSFHFNWFIISKFYNENLIKKLSLILNYSYFKFNTFCNRINADMQVRQDVSTLLYK